VIADNLGMSLPRAIVPGRRYMITRRCSERRFFMRPDRETNNAFIYCLALAARKASISIVCVGTLSNHYHAVVVDNHGRLPQFLEHFHKLYGKHQNALRGRWEAFWASEQTSVVELVKAEDVLRKMVYAIANPVTSHLVERVHHWPGVESLTAIDHNLPLTATKPVRFYDPENGDLPDVIDLHFRRAPGFERLSHVEYSKLLRDRVAEAEEKAAAERREKGIKLLGRGASYNSTGTRVQARASLAVDSRHVWHARTPGRGSRPCSAIRLSSTGTAKPAPTTWPAAKPSFPPAPGGCIASPA
jgi:hypothetical protein